MKAIAFAAIVIGAGLCLVDKDKPRRIKQTLLSNPASARTGHVRSLLLGSVQVFFEADIVAKEEAPHGAATTGDTRCILGHNHLIQCQIWFVLQSGSKTISHVFPTAIRCRRLVSPRRFQSCASAAAN